jgi:hypothetical protein
MPFAAKAGQDRKIHQSNQKYFKQKVQPGGGISSQPVEFRLKSKNFADV